MLLCGSGFRLRKDIDFGYKQIVVKNPKGEKDRTTMLHEKVIEPLKDHLKKVKKIHEEDLKKWIRHSMFILCDRKKISKCKV